MAVINVGNESTFDEKILTATQPVMVDFWASWCGPCKMAGPEVEALEVELAGKAIVAKVNIDELPGLTSRFNVKSVPTFIIFKDGKEVSRFTGYKTRKDMAAALEKV